MDAPGLFTWLGQALNGVTTLLPAFLFGARLRIRSEIGAFYFLVIPVAGA